ncbi:hypothetical protein BY996DRAFT_6418159 [Phakopsora pachyrhizi]|nr:hypothetical protein BY996DRAFT_6418159 [Phakopsora pachyrhizi]
MSSPGFPSPNSNQYYQHPQPSNTRNLRLTGPDLAPVPPQLRQSVISNHRSSNQILIHPHHRNPSFHPTQPNSSRPALPPLPPSHYRTQPLPDQSHRPTGANIPVSSDQQHFRQSSSSPYAAPLTVENLQFQSNQFQLQNQGPVNFSAPTPSRARSVGNRSEIRQPQSFGQHPPLPPLSRVPTYQHNHHHPQPQPYQPHPQPRPHPHPHPHPQPQVHLSQSPQLPPLPTSPNFRGSISRADDVHQAFQSLSVSPNSAASGSNFPTASNLKPISLPVIDLDYLKQSYKTHFQLSPNPQQQIKWASKVIKFIERSQAEPLPENSSTLSASDPNHPTRISEPLLVQYTDIALRTILKFASSHDPSSVSFKDQKCMIPESIYLRGDLSSTGAFPTYQPKDLKAAFRDFETAAQLGYHLAWFRIGREYEVCEDWDRALGAYEHGENLGECACTYRLGMCYLLGQVNLQVDLRRAVGHLKAAAHLADEITPQPAYIYGMLLAEDFDALPMIPNEILKPNLTEARQMIEKSAYLGFAAAQYKLGWCYEYSQLNCPYDPLLSVEYYSLASKQGESEADMALSKWFLCGAEGYFRPNENLAFTFSEKAAKKGLGSAMFAIGYYLEVGIGVEKNGKKALEWYKKALEETGNEDARERLLKLSEGGEMLSRGEHEVHLNQKLVRKHTLAAQKSPMNGLGGITGLRRKETMRKVEEARRVAEMGVMATNELEGRLSRNSSHSQIDRASTPTLSQQAQMSSPERLKPNRSPKRLMHQKSQPHLKANQDGSSLTNLRDSGIVVAGYQLSDSGPVPPPQSIIVDNKHQNQQQAPGVGGEQRVEKVQFNSFADMGIQTAKAKKSEDCIIA